jgi:hypothetical protein
MFEIQKAEDHSSLISDKIFPNATIKSYAAITVVAAPHLFLSRFFVSGVLTHQSSFQAINQGFLTKGLAQELDCPGR